MNLSWTTVRLPYKHVFRISRDVDSYGDSVIVKAEYNGKTGWGEGQPDDFHGDSVEAIDRACELFRNATSSGDEPETLLKQLDRLQIASPGGRTAIEMALLDLVERRTGRPLCERFGARRDGCPATSMTLGIDTPEVIRRKLAEIPDYPILKVKLGSDHDKAIIDTIRNETDRVIRVDANTGWQRDEAARMADWLAERNVEFIEQPLKPEDLDGTAWLRERSPLPILADEAVTNAADIPRLDGVYDGINIKLMKAGGVLEAHRMIQDARKRGMLIMLGCFLESSVSITAAAHLSPLVDYADLDGNVLIADDPFTGVTSVAGQLKLPEGNGLGVTLVKEIGL